MRVDLIRLLVRFVDPVIRINVTVRGRTAAIPQDIQSLRGIILCVKDVELVLVRVSTELGTDRVPEAFHNAIIFTGIDGEARLRWQVSEEVHLLVVSLGQQEGVVQPLQLSPWERGFIENPPVHGLALVVIDRDDSQSRTNKDRVISTQADSFQCRFGEPRFPLVRKVVVQPLGRETKGNRRGRKYIHRVSLVVSQNWENCDSRENTLQ